MNVKHIAIIILLLSGFLTCKKISKPLKPNITGRNGEVIVVMDKYLWESAIGDTCRKFLNQPYMVLPQQETMFDVVYFPTSSFSDFLKTHRNILIAEISSEYDSSFLVLQKDLWAKSQLIIRLNAPSKDSLQSLLNKNKEKITALFNGIERQRITKIYHQSQHAEISKVLLDSHNLQIRIPRSFKLDKDSNNFIWLSYEDAYIIQGIFIYYYNYTDKNTFTKDFIIKKRNELLKKNVSGRVEGSYMTTEALFDPLFSDFMFKGNYFAELRGLWKMANGDFMGGPFVSLTTLDKERNRVVCIEGFVYAPNKNKRNYLKEVEAICYSLEIK